MISPLPVGLHEIDGSSVFPLGTPAGGRVRVRIVGGPEGDMPPLDALTAEAVERVWSGMRRENPRLFDGPVLSVLRLDAETGLITVRRGSYKRVAVQLPTGDGGRSEPPAGTPRIRTGEHQLAVTGVLIGRDRAGAEHVLLGRRGPETRMYEGMWELAPAGGVDPPKDAGEHEMGFGAILDAIAKEAAEELGVEMDWPSLGRAVGVVRDAVASSDDIAIWAELPFPIDPHRPLVCAAEGDDWEYVDTAWVPLTQIAAFDRDHAGAIIPPARALFRALGWA